MKLILAEATQPAGTPWTWGVFAAVVIAVLALDLGVFHRDSHKLRLREAAVWVAVWVSLAMVFCAWIMVDRALKDGIEFATAYVVELSLSVDNIFVFVFIFGYFGVRPELQHRVLFWGIVGAIVMRMLFIFTAIALLERFRILFYPFGLFLVFTGIKFLYQEPEAHPERNILLRLARRFLPVSRDFHGQRFFVREPGTPAVGAPASSTAAKGRLVVTPLFLVLIALEATDVVFAVDSVPAVIGITQDRFIAYTSNIFAILGLRSMYFLLINFLDKFRYLKFGLSFVLIFIGAKMLGQSLFEVSAVHSLLVVAGLLGASVAASLMFPEKKEPRNGEPAP